MSAAPLAIESGEKRTDPNLAAFGVLISAVAMLAAFGGLFAAWLSLRQGSAAWPPKGVSVENYYGTTLTVTLLLAGLAGEWVRYGVRREDRTQVVAASTVLLVLGLGFINLLSFVLHGAHFGPATHAYGELYFAFNLLIGATVVAALALSALALARYLGEQVSPGEPALAHAVAWFWWATLLAWLIVYVAVYVVK